MTTTKKKPVNKAKAIELSNREAPVERQQSVKDFLAPLFNDAQMRLLVNQTPEYAKMKRPGAGGRMLTYVKHGYVTDQLNKAFGFDWDLIIDPMSNGQMYALQIETFKVVDARTNKPMPDKEVRHVAVCGHLVVRVHDSKGNVKGSITKSGFGSQIWLPSMEFGDALKAAKSDLLKVCAAQVGVALDLYWNDMSEVSKFEEEQERKRLEQEQQEILEASFVDDNHPVNGVQLLARAKSELGLELDEIEKRLGMKFAQINETYKVEYWDKLKG